MTIHAPHADDAYAALRPHALEIKQQTLTDLFATDPQRVETFTRRICGLHVDTSKQHWTPDTLALLGVLAERRDVGGCQQAQWGGAPVNNTEGRPALHMALRCAGLPGSDDAARVRMQMQALTRAAHAGTLTGQPVEAIIHIGVGGSALGPQLVLGALAEARSRPVYVLDNIDGAALSACLRRINPARTLVVVASKTFTTLETMANAAEVRTVFENALGAGAMRHFIAATANPQAARDWGIEPDHILPFWDWVGGRFSLWSAVGISIPLSLGWPSFETLLEGAAAMDAHCRTAAVPDHLPLHLAMLDVWNHTVLGHASRVVAPYASRLSALVGWVQQLEMESNGKGVDIHGQPLTCAAAPVVWGGTGTTAQHAFFQSLHQGVDPQPVEFVLVARPRPLDGPPEMHQAQLANGLAQAAALMSGQAHADPHQAFAGNRPSTTILIDELTPARLGSLLALYEHKTACAAWLWGVNPFDQYGVELGKRIARDLTPRLGGHDGPRFDPSTEALIAASRLR